MHAVVGVARGRRGADTRNQDAAAVGRGQGLLHGGCVNAHTRVVVGERASGSSCLRGGRARDGDVARVTASKHVGAHVNVDAVAAACGGGFAQAAEEHSGPRSAAGTRSTHGGSRDVNALRAWVHTAGSTRATIAAGALDAQVANAARNGDGGLADAHAVVVASNGGAIVAAQAGDGDIAAECGNRAATGASRRDARSPVSRVTDYHATVELGARSAARAADEDVARASYLGAGAFDDAHADVAATGAYRRGGAADGDVACATQQSYERRCRSSVSVSDHHAMVVTTSAPA